MPFKPGDPNINRKGRPAGSKTRARLSGNVVELGDKLDDALLALAEYLQDDVLEMSAYQRARIFVQLLPYRIARKNENKIELSGIIKQIDQLSDNQVNSILEIVTGENISD